MKIGEVIRSYRKAKEMTQEEMAEYLGVSAPAVNKWEKGVSMPDITLLAPIARLLGISTDTLLSYQVKLTDMEIGQIIEEAYTKMRSEDYDSVFCWAEQRMQEYPNCDWLIFTMTQVLDSYRNIMGLDEPEKYDDKICGFYVRLLDSGERTVMQRAALALFYFYLGKEEYDRAGEYLNRIPEQDCDPKRQRALLYRKQGKTEEAYRMYEQFLLEDYNNMNFVLDSICMLAIGEGDTARAEYMAAKQRGLAELLEMGKYQQAVPEFILAMCQRDKERIIQALEEAIHNIKDIFSFRKSPLYAHIDFKDTSPESMIHMLEQCLEKDTELDFLKDDSRYEQLVAELKRISEGIK